MALAINLTTDQLTVLASLAKKSLPAESCALLLGSCDDSDLQVAEITPLTNIDGSPHSFSVEPSELLAAYDSAEKRSLQVIAIFHSHPGRPYPSTTDLKYMELNPVVWLIYSTTEDRFGAYKIDEDTMRVDVRVRD